MALYLAIVLYAALIALPEEERLDVGLSVAMIWGTAVGLALAHWFAFGLAAWLVAGGRPGATERRLARAQLTAAATVAALASLPLLLLGGDAYEATEGALAMLIAGTGYATGRHAGEGVGKSVILAAIVLAVAAAIITFKAAVGH